MKCPKCEFPSEPCLRCAHEEVLKNEPVNDLSIIERDIEKINSQMDQADAKALNRVLEFVTFEDTKIKLHKDLIKK